MSAALWIAGGVSYVLIGTYLWRRWAWEFAQDSFTVRSEAIVFGWLLSCVWPIALPLRLVLRSDAFMLPPPSVRARDREALLQAEIDRLERELRVGAKQ